jgi:class 3 adenylate cyclase/CHASE2 domain-containing sensor protein
MTRSEKQLLSRTMAVGLFLTLAVIVADGAGLLDPLERYLYDQRARHCQFFTPPPSDKIVHLDIDDPSQSQIGWFPWPRTKLAMIIDELHRAGAKVVGLDIIFSEPQDVRWEKEPDGTFKEIDDDKNFADSVRAAGNVLAPISVIEQESNAPSPQLLNRLLDYALPTPAGLGHLLSSDTQITPVESLIDAAKYCGVVDFASGADSVIRSVQLFVNYRGKLMPHMALAAACAELDVPISSLKITPDSITIPVPGNPIVIPVRPFNSDRYGRIGLVMDIPWFGALGKDNWLTMYDYPKHLQPRQHVPLGNVWDVCQNQLLIEHNNREIDDALRAVKGIESSDKLDAFLAHPNDADRAAVAQATLSDLVSLDPSIDSEKPADSNSDDAKLVAAYHALRQAMAKNQSFDQLIQTRRAELREKLNGKYALIGWTATARTDFYPTPLQSLCPGVVIQGAVFNAIMTRHFWTMAPWWIGAIVTLIVGALTTFTVALIPIWRALAITLLIVGGYLFFNGIVLFDHGGYILAAAAPITAATMIWFGVTVSRFIYERRERSRITKRFSRYVDPTLVNFVVEHPEAAHFEGELREMTIVFTDLAGFTTISEKLREKTVPLLNDYMSLMLPVIRQNNGYWNKFLGDGIMFFFNAPAENLHHARDAVRTVLQMQKQTQLFNQHLRDQALPQVAMRAGIATGTVVVGDAGSTDPDHYASDYTVLGDEVNLASRLESANKALGSRVLMSEATAVMLGDEFLLRPMGNFRVVGRSEGVNTFEALCPRNDATDRQKQAAEISTRIIECFRQSRFDECINAVHEFAEIFGSTKFTQLYLELCREYQLAPPENGFNGLIILSEK